MEIKSKHLKMTEMRPLKDRLSDLEIFWDLGPTTRSDTTAPCSWTDGVMTMPGQGKGQVPPFIWLDYDETLMWEKRSDTVVYDETEQS